MGALNWTSYNIIGPLVNTATNPGCNYGLYLSDLDAGRFSFRNFYGASLDSAWAVSGMGSAAGIAKAGYNSSFSQYYGANLNPNNQWLTRGRYSLDVAMKKLSSPGEWTGMRGVQVPWEKYVGGPRIAAPKFGKSGWGIEYKIGGFGFTKEGNWIEYFGDWLKAAVDVVIK